MALVGYKREIMRIHEFMSALITTPTVFKAAAGYDLTLFAKKRCVTGFFF